MQYLTDPKSGNELSILGFGCMRFPLDTSKTERLILTAIARGVNYFDTAYIYGNSETILGGILHKHNMREKIFLATKLPFNKCKTYNDFDRLFQIQLERLKTDYIDYYLIHNMSEAEAWKNLCEIGIEKWIAEKKTNGQIRQIGFSFHGPRDCFMEMLDIYDWDFCQIQYNYMDENYQAGRAGLLKAHEKGLPVIIMEPLLGGKLATGLPRKAAKLFAETGDSGTAASWAFRWLWNQPEVTVVLSGMNGADQLEDNLKTAETAKPHMLKDKDAAIYTPVIAAIREAYKVSCTGCNYCMPCPKGVDIPNCFSAYNVSYAIGYVSGLILYVTSTGINRPEKDHSAKQCLKCGACEKKCPQHIEIPKELANVKKRMNPFWFGAIMGVVRLVTK